MIETLVMPLPSDVTDAIIDIAVVLGELFYIMITIYHLFYRWTIVSICLLSNNSCKFYHSVSLSPPHPHYCCVIITPYHCVITRAVKHCDHYPVILLDIIICKFTSHGFHLSVILNQVSINQWWHSNIETLKCYGMILSIIFMKYISWN